MPSHTFYAQQMLNLHKKYGLSENAQVLLKAFDDFKFGRIDQQELGRIVRLSKNMRKAITDTIKKCAQTMASKPSEVKSCVEIIQCCTEILSAADQPPSLEEFPLMRLPSEIRRNVYEFYVRKMFASKQPRTLMHGSKKSKCHCSLHEPMQLFLYNHVKLTLAETSKQIRDEFLTYLYGSYTFHFSCACDMLENLRNCAFLRRKVQSIKVHWNGPDSDKAFDFLKKCHSLKDLHITISRATTHNLTDRETDMNRYFTTQKRGRISDALGLDELIQLRGLESVTVSHTLVKQCTRRSDEDRANLHALLVDKLTLPRSIEPADSDEEEESG